MEYYKENYINVDENMVNILNNKGYGVIRGVLNEEEIEKAKNGLWNTLNYLTKHFDHPIEKNKPNTWNTYYNLDSNRNLIIQNWQIGHSQFVWDIRQNKKVVNVFSKIWEVDHEDLLTSFDAISFHIPPELTNIGYHDKEKSWWHTDQAPNNKQFSCVQGMIMLYDVNVGDSTLSVLENSSQFHKELFEWNQVKKNCNWHEFNKKDIDFFMKKGCTTVNVLAKAGDLILWDSRTAHFGMGPLKERTKSNIRAGVYICMTPRKWIDEKNLQMKQNAFNNMEMTTHWPHKIKKFKKYTKKYEIIPNIPNLPKPFLNELGKRLAGF